jgi:hypothetical protein
MIISAKKKFFSEKSKQTGSAKPLLKIGEKNEVLYALYHR